MKATFIMHPTRILMGLAVLAAVTSLSSWADGLLVEGYTVEGGTSVLTFVNVPTAVVYVVESALSPAGEWQTAQAARAPVGQLSVEMNGQPVCFHRIVAGVTNSVTPEPDGMVLIPAGSFQMGDNLGDGRSEELPVHTVYVSAFYMDRTEVTWAKWQEVRTWAETNEYDIGTTGAAKGSTHPVYNLNWYGVVKWCNARSQMEGKATCYTRGGNIYRTGEYDDIVCNWSAPGYRLPTEAEWEKAARGGFSGKRFPWGDTIDHTRANYQSYWKNGAPVYCYDLGYYGYDTRYATGDYPYTSPVASFAANGYGLHDMSGSLMEWCWDWFDDYPSGSVSNPRGPLSPSGYWGSARVVRDGIWRS
ncbi:MAG: SUMF1/EgtB/PvdO family nonheme iron enzyme, partial [Kiritimatiellae bacterium]|nr:SUMF1/EgtB/PvdO family nonheme iron enzyme [Kiritimatiellia bacterium]